MILPYTNSTDFWFSAEFIWELVPEILEEVIEAAIGESDGAAPVDDSAAATAGFALAALAPLIEPPVSAPDVPATPAPRAEPAPSPRAPDAGVHAGPTRVLKGIRWVARLAWHMLESAGWQRQRDDQLDDTRTQGVARAGREQALLRRRVPG